MNKALSKKLIFGVIATSMVLVNCQKAPPRGVKPKGAVGTAMNNKIENADVSKMKVCTGKLKAAMTEQFITQTKYNEARSSVKTEADAEAKKEELNKLVAKLNSQCEVTKKLFAEEKLASCKVDTSNSPTSARVAAELDKACATVGKDAKTVTKVENELATKAEKIDAATTSDIFEVNTTFVVSRDLGDLLESSDKADISYVAGQSYNGSTAFIGAIQDNKTVCKISLKGEKLAENSKLKLVQSKNSKTEKGSLQVIMSLTSINGATGGSAYEMTCDVTKAEVNQAKTAILTAFGDHLKVAQAEAATATSAAVESVANTPARSTEAPKTSGAQGSTRAGLVAETPAIQTAQAPQTSAATSAPAAAAPAVVVVTESTEASQTIEDRAKADLAKAEEAMKKQQELEKAAAAKAQAAKDTAAYSAQATIHAAKSSMYADEAKRQSEIAAKQAQIAKDKAKEAADLTAEEARIKESNAKSSFRKSEIQRQNQSEKNSNTMFGPIFEYFFGMN